VIERGVQSIHTHTYALQGNTISLDGLEPYTLYEITVQPRAPSGSTVVPPKTTELKRTNEKGALLLTVTYNQQVVQIAPDTYPHFRRKIIHVCVGV
jgi:hypothetical protein